MNNKTLFEAKLDFDNDYSFEITLEYITVNDYIVTSVCRKRGFITSMYYQHFDSVKIGYRHVKTMIRRAEKGVQ